jgi:hypothetical protein
MINRTLLSRYSAVMKGGRGARRRTRTFSPYDFRNNGKHGGIERKITFAVPSIFSRTIHERKLRSLFHRVFHERFTNVVYVRCSVSFFMFEERTWFTFAVPLGSFYEGLCSWITFAVPYSVELNVSHGLRSPFNSHERSLETEHGTIVELPTVLARNNGTNLFYHSFYSLVMNGWMFFRISPWGSLTEKTHGTANVKNTGERRRKSLRNNERGVMEYEIP